MRALRAAAAFIVLLGLVGCGGSKPPAMPTVVGQKLDVALSDIKRAGFSNDVEVLGGGVLGVIDKSNWTVCAQEPAAGQTISSAPRLKVDRTCGGATPAPAMSSSTQATPSPMSTPSPSATASPSAEPVITVANNADFAALATTTDDCGELVQAFARNYAGRTIRFDGSVGAMSKFGDYKTRYIIGVNFGDDGQGTKGPNFVFEDVNIVSDLHLTGPNLPDTMKVGDNLRITAKVGEFPPNQCRLLLTPVSTEYR